MSNTKTNANTATTRKGTRGPKPIQTVAQLRENLMRDALAREMRKIDRKIATQTRIRKNAQNKANDATAVIESLAKIRAEFLAESGVKA